LVIPDKGQGGFLRIGLKYCSLNEQTGKKLPLKLYKIPEFSATMLFLTHKKRRLPGFPRAAEKYLLGQFDAN